jgi:hypothetical protein
VVGQRERPQARAGGWPRRLCDSRLRLEWYLDEGRVTVRPAPIRATRVASVPMRAQVVAIALLIECGLLGVGGIG